MEETRLYTAGTDIKQANIAPTLNTIAAPPASVADICEMNDSV